MSIQLGDLAPDFEADTRWEKNTPQSFPSHS
jgi:hypothetical protein